MPIDAPLEALKAQAVVTRSFLAAGPRHRDFDFCDTTHCQFLRSPDDVNARVAQAVASTHSLVLSWHNQTLSALYSSRCGGQTRSLSDVGMKVNDAYPYYSVQCRWCRDHPVRWKSRLDPSARAPQSSNESARIAYVRLTGWSALPGSNFIVSHDAGGSVLDGKSIGHSLGLCQFGAIGLAASGADFRSILAHYYPNTDVTQLTE
jgi:stage II sporulation protein D